MKRLITLLLLALSFLAAPAFAADAANDFPAAKVLFDTGRADVGAEGQAAVRAVADYLKAHAGAKVQLSGFTDTTGDAAVNEELAKQRAVAVRVVLVRIGVPEDKVELKKPEVTTGSGDNAEARRVEVLLID